MKKFLINNLKYLLVFTLSFCAGCFINGNNIFIKSKPNMIVISPIEKIKYKIKRKDISFITLIDNASDKHIKEVYKLINPKIMKKLEDKNYRIFITEDSIFDLLEENKIKIPKNSTGINISGFKVILSINKLDVIIHEIGHAVDFDLCNKNILLNYKSYSNNPEFIEIYNKEKDSLFLDGLEYYKTSVEEYFAESFVYYFLYEETIKEQAPLTYNYLNDILNKLIEKD